MGSYILTMIIVVYGAQGLPATATSISTEYSSETSCTTALKHISNNIRDGGVSHASCTPK